MTHPSRKYLVVIPIFVSFALLLSYGGIFTGFLLKGRVEALYSAAKDFVPVVAPRTVLFMLTLQAAFSAAAILSLYLSFRKTHSAEVFFFLYGLLGFAVQSSRFFMAPAALVALSAYSLIPLTRLVYFGRIFTALSFFAAGLFSNGVASQRRNFFLSMILLVSFIIAATIPVDFTSITRPLLFAIDDKIGLSLAFYALSAFTVLNFIFAAYNHSEPAYLLVALAVLFVITGMDLMFYYPHGVWSLIGLVSALGGTALFAERTHEIYLWI
jgi:hypothetical protein